MVSSLSWQYSVCVCVCVCVCVHACHNSVFVADLPILLQALRGCYNLKHLAVSGNPVTQEKSFQSYLLKAVPSLEVLERKSGAPVTFKSKKSAMQEVLMSSNVYRTCLNQIHEQDQLKRDHSQQLE